jgi:hypothetical protein
MKIVTRAPCRARDAVLARELQLPPALNHEVLL